MKKTFFLILLYAFLPPLSIKAQKSNRPLTILDFGAIPNDGLDDTEAFKAYNRYINKNGGGAVTITGGVFNVGKQIFNTNPKDNIDYAVGDTIFIFQNLKNLTISFAPNTKMVFNKNMKFGQFNPQTGQVSNLIGSGTNPDCPNFFNTEYRASLPTMFSIKNCENVQLNNLQLDGNLKNLVAGGKYGDCGYQTGGIGIWIQSCKNYTVNNCLLENFALDGMMVSVLEEQYHSNTPLSKAYSPEGGWVKNSRFSKNLRQGLSIVASKSIKIEHCLFDSTGKGTHLTSNPSAGIDVEGEIGSFGTIDIADCDFFDNKGWGFLSTNGYSPTKATLKNCTFVGLTQSAVNIQLSNYVLDNCRIYGQAYFGSLDSTKPMLINNCLFYEKYEGKKAYGDFLLQVPSGRYAIIDNCSFWDSTVYNVVMPVSKARYVNTIKNSKFYIQGALDMNGYCHGCNLDNLEFHQSEKAAKKGTDFYLSDSRIKRDLTHYANKKKVKQMKKQQVVGVKKFTIVPE